MIGRFVNMKKLTLIYISALSAFTINSACAGDYSDAVNNEKMCSALGDIAVSTYKSRKTPGAREKALKGTTPSPNDDSYRAESKKVMRLAQTYALDRAQSPKDAYLTAWGYCMDRGK